MNIKILFCAPLLLLMSNCKTQTAPAETSAAANNMITLDLTKSSKIPDSKVTLQFKEIVEDSRCPVDVTCVWEGVAVVEMQAKSGSESKTIRVGTRDFDPKNIKKTFSFAGYKFTLTDLKPQPGGKETTISATLKYEKE